MVKNILFSVYLTGGSSVLSALVKEDGGGVYLGDMHAMQGNGKSLVSSKENNDLNNNVALEVSRASAMLGNHKSTITWMITDASGQKIN